MTTGMEELVLNVVFYVFAIGAVVASLAVALSTNIIRSAFALLGVLFAVAGFYAFMRADFIVAAQIIIYVGGILVLIIFAVMLTHRITDVNVSNESAPGPAAVFAVLCVLFALCVIIATWKWERTAEPERVVAKASLAGDTGETSAEMQVSLSRGDGTGMPAGGEMRDPFMAVSASVIKAPTRAKSASVEIQKSVHDARTGKDGAWTRVAEAAFAVENGAGSGSQRLINLEPARYRWVASFADDQGPLNLAGKGACASCGAAGVPGTGCATQACKERGLLIDPVTWTVTGKEWTLEVGLTRPLGRSLMNRYLLAFEVVSVLLLAALVGAAYIARKEVKDVA
jgi:NADH-quinone oxidoreductase subunit J